MNFILKPGGVFKEDWCTVCQCINNAYVCDSSSCLYEPTTEKIELTTLTINQTTVFEELTTSYKEIINNITTINLEKGITEEPLSTTETKQFFTDYISTVKWPESTTLRPLTVFTISPPEELSTVKNIETTTEEEIIFIPSTVSPPMILCDVHQ